MVAHSVSLRIFLLASCVGLATLQARAETAWEDGDSFVSDQAESESSAEEADQGDVIAPAQFQLRPRSSAGAGRGTTSQAALSRSGQQSPQISELRLANTPKMMGDFFGQSFSSSSHGSVFVGRSVHHADPPSIYGENDFHLIDETGSVVLYVGGPEGNSPGSFFIPGPSPPAPDLVEGLHSDISGVFSASKTTDTVDVYNYQSDPNPDLADAAVFNIYRTEGVVLPSGGPGDIVGRVRINENNSAMPQDRIYFDYSYFHNVAYSQGKLDVNRFAPGFEKTAFNGLASVELRVPMGISLSNDILSDQPADLSSAEFGNMVVSPKLLLWGSDNAALALGLGIALPTAEDIRVSMTDGTQLLWVKNESLHLLPYLGFLYSPQQSNHFAHAFLTLDVDANGNTTYANASGTGLERVGVWNDQSLLSANVAVGSWLSRNFSRHSRLQGIAWSAEVHYTETLNDADFVSGGTYSVGNAGSDLSLVNATAGLHALVGMTTFTAGYAAPLTSSDRIFDGELRVFVNRAF